VVASGIIEHCALSPPQTMAHMAYVHGWIQSMAKIVTLKFQFGSQQGHSGKMSRLKS